MLCVRPLRMLGMLGTPDNPIYYDSGDRVPLHMEIIYPFRIKATFVVDVCSYYEKGVQKVESLEHFETGFFIELNGDAKNKDLYMQGAPTDWVVGGDGVKRSYTGQVFRFSNQSKS